MVNRVGWMWRPVRDCPGDHVLVRLKLSWRKGHIFLSGKKDCVLEPASGACWTELEAGSLERQGRVLRWTGSPTGCHCSSGPELRVVRMVLYSEPLLGSRASVAGSCLDLTAKSVFPSYVEMGRGGETPVLSQS